MWQLGCAASMLAATWSKEVAVVMPAVLLLYDWVFLQSSPGETLRRRGFVHLLVVLAALRLVWAALPAAVGPSEEAIAKGAEVSAGFGLPPNMRPNRPWRSAMATRLP